MNNILQKKKKKPNGFFLFVLDFKKKLTDNNNEIYELNRIKNMAAPHWNNLSQAEKNKYKEKAKFSDVPMNDDQKKKSKKFNCKGIDIAVGEAQKENEKVKNSEMVADIKALLNDANDLGELDFLVLYFISTSSFIDSCKEIYPAELAIAKFSLKEGVFDDIQIRIDPGELPLGSAFQAKCKADKNHKLPCYPNCEGETNYMTILETMIKFLHPLDKLPIFFTEGNTRDNKIPLQETRKIVSKIFYESQEDDLINDLKIYPIEELLFTMQSVTVITKNRQNGTDERQFLSIISASNSFSIDDYKYLTRGCEFHNNLVAAEFCCLSKVRCYAYNIVKWCANGNRYALKEGQHYPYNFTSTK